MFESTFRARVQPDRPWSLVQVTDSYDQIQFSVVFDRTQFVIGIGVMDVQSQAQMVYFRHTSVFNEEWHKITLSVTNDRATLWIDCILIQGIHGEYYESLLPRRAFDKTGGQTSVSRVFTNPQTSALVSLFHEIES